MKRLVALVLLSLALLAPVAAAQVSDPFGPTPQPVAPAPSDDGGDGNSSTTNKDDGLESWQQVLIFLGGGILLVGIGWAIVSDARRNAPATEEELHGSKHDAHHQLRKSRARKKQKIAKASRKKNRPR
ncbi:MAG: hypothetical protein HZB46_16360 [Solirubrobacterales bacterium]|nr:hypothetical protein [Solirubrobacterales bacterium]